MLRAETQLPNDFSVAQVLQRQAPRPPLVARRHLFETGTLRFFDVHFADASRLDLGGAPRMKRGEEATPSGDGDGVVILTLPRTEREAGDLRGKQGIAGLAIERLGGGKPVVLVVPENAGRLTQLARELAASLLVRTSTPELQSDPAARSELSGRIEELERQIGAEAGRAFESTPRRLVHERRAIGRDVVAGRVERAVRSVRRSLPGCATDQERAAESSGAFDVRGSSTPQPDRGDDPTPRLSPVGLRGQPARTQHVSIPAGSAWAASPARRRVGFW